MRFLPLFVFLSVSLQANEPPDAPVEPSEALDTIHVRDGYTIELVAAEPLVMDPVAIAWGADGKLWVAEMADYPMGMDEEGTPGGRVRFLEDTDGDGKMDESVLFAEGLNFPSGVLPWRDGVLVTAAPEILLLRDTDGDGVSDSREVLFRGFAEDNQQLRVNGLRRGLDNWIYCASGTPRAGRIDNKVESLRSGELHELGSLDFRFRPDTGELEVQSGPTQFGRNRDEWGNWFGCMNSYPLWHYVLEDHWLQRNPHVIPPDPRRQLILPRNPKVYPAKAPQKRFHSFHQTGRFTSSCGGMIYRDELLFSRMNGKMHAFSCEPFHNLVQHILVEEDGVSFRAERDPDDGPVDFFASTDRWCRPVMARTGPDGALWVVDMYRYIIEHSQFLPEIGKKELGEFLREGEDRGRIYRIFPTNKPPRELLSITGESDEALVGMLASPNGPTRDLAQEQIIERDVDISVSGESAYSRLHVLYVLDGLDRLTSGEGLTDAHPEVRRNAIRLAEKFDDSIDALVQMTEDSDPRVRLQLAATLGEWPENPKAAEALGRLAIRDGGDVHFDAAVLSSASPENIEALTDATLSDNLASDGAGDLAGRLLALSIAYGKNDVTRSGLAKIVAAGANSQRYAMVAGLLDALDHHDTSVEALLGDDTLELDQFIQEAKSVAGDKTAPLRDRSTALRLLPRSPIQSDRLADLETLGELLQPSTPAKLQSAVIAHLAALDDPEVADVLLAGWKSHGPSIRTEILGVLPSRHPWTAKLLDSLESGDVSPANIGLVVQLAMRRGTDASGRERIAALFAEGASATDSRKAAVEEWKPALEMVGDRQRGAEIFKAVCAACHQLDGVGNDVGADIASLSDRRPIALFTAILDPNAQLDARYTNYVATTKEGTVHVGFLAAETSNSVTLKGADGQTHDILRENLKSLESTGLSLMPDGLEAAMDKQQLADLIAYLEKAGLPGE